MARKRILERVFKANYQTPTKRKEMKRLTANKTQTTGAFTSAIGVAGLLLRDYGAPIVLSLIIITIGVIIQLYSIHVAIKESGKRMP